MRFTQIFLFLFTLCALRGAAQQPGKAMLWEISGNGLTQPSYLFGTIHVRDKAVFNFCDSMFICMDRCEAFASEVHPDSQLHYLYSSAIPTEISMEDVYAEFDLWGSSGLGESPEEMGTIVQGWGQESETTWRFFQDMYLVRLAGQKGKKAIMLHGPGNTLQLEMLLSMEERGDVWENDPAESLTSLYLKGDPDQMNKTNLDADSFLSGLLARDTRKINTGMIEALTANMQSKSVFAALSALRLGGPDGILQLLKEKGYRLRPVAAQFSGKELPALQKTDKADIRWNSMQLGESGLQIDVPGEHHDFIQMDDMMGVTMKVALDVKRNFITLYVEVPRSNAFDAEEAEEDVSEYFARRVLSSSDLKTVSKKTWEEKGFQQGEYTMLKDSGQVLVKLRRVSWDSASAFIMLGTINDKEGQKLMKQAEKTLRSRKTVSAPLFPYSPPGLDVSLLVSGDVSQVKNQIVSKTGITNEHKVYFRDTEAGVVWSLRVSEDFSPFLPRTDSETVSRLIDQILYAPFSFDLEELDSVQFENKGEYWQFTAGAGGQNPKKGRVWIKGNRSYMFVAAGSPQGNPERMDQILNSLQFSVPKQPEITLFTNGIYQLRAPEEKYHAINLPVQKMHTWLRENTPQITSPEAHFFRAFPGGPLLVAQHIRFPDYYQWHDQQALVNDFLKYPFLFAIYTEMAPDDVKNNEGGVEITFHNFADFVSIHLRGRAILKNREAIVVYAAGDSSALLDSRVTDILNSFAPGSAFHPQGDFYEDQRARLLADIDTVQSLEAAQRMANAVAFLTWNAEHLPELMRLSGKNYPQAPARAGDDERYEIEYNRGENTDLGKQLFKAIGRTQGPGKATFVNERVAALAGIASSQIIDVFDLIFSLPENESIPLAAQIWKQHLRGKERHLLFDCKGWDSLQAKLTTTLPYLSDLTGMAMDTSYQYENHVLSLLLSGLDEGVYPPSILPPYRNQIKSELIRFLADAGREKPDEFDMNTDVLYRSHIFQNDIRSEIHTAQLIRLLGHLEPAADTDALVAKLFESGKPELLNTLMRCWIMQGRTARIPVKLLPRLTQNKAEMLELWKMLDRKGKLDYFPASQKDQQLFASMWADDFLAGKLDDFRLSRERMVMKKNIMHNGDSVVVYLYKIQGKSTWRPWGDWRDFIYETGDSTELENWILKKAEGFYLNDSGSVWTQKLAAYLKDTENQNGMLLIGPFRPGKENVSTDCSLCRFTGGWGTYKDEERIRMLLDSPAVK